MDGDETVRGDSGDPPARPRWGPHTRQGGTGPPASPPGGRGRGGSCTPVTGAERTARPRYDMLRLRALVTPRAARHPRRAASRPCGGRGAGLAEGPRHRRRRPGPLPAAGGRSNREARLPGGRHPRPLPRCSRRRRRSARPVAAVAAGPSSGERHHLPTNACKPPCMRASTCARVRVDVGDSHGARQRSAHPPAGGAAARVSRRAPAWRRSRAAR